MFGTPFAKVPHAGPGPGRGTGMKITHYMPRLEEYWERSYCQGSSIDSIEALRWRLYGLVD